MKNRKETILLLVLFSMLIACTTTPKTPKFEDIINRDWSLVEVRSGQQTIVIDRGRADGFDTYFLHFDEEQISGVGAPNRYFGRYSLEENQGMSIGGIAGTLMATLFEQENFREHEFFGCLQNVTKWNLAGDILELYTSGQDKSEAILIFKLAE